MCACACGIEQIKYTSFIRFCCRRKRTITTRFDCWFSFTQSRDIIQLACDIPIESMAIFDAKWRSLWVTYSNTFHIVNYRLVWLARFLIKCEKMMGFDLWTIERSIDWSVDRSLARTRFHFDLIIIHWTWIIANSINIRWASEAVDWDAHGQTTVNANNNRTLFKQSRWK